MSYSKSERLFWELLEISDSVLYVDNDMCYVTYGENEDGDCESQSFDFGPKDLVFILADKLDIKVDSV